MHFAVLACSGGALLYLSSVAAVALSAGAGAFEVGWLAVLPIAFLYAASGFLAMGGRSARSIAAVAICAGGSLLTTGVTVFAAALAAVRFPIPMGTGIAGAILVLCFFGGIAILVLAAQLSRGDGVVST